MSDTTDDMEDGLGRIEADLDEDAEDLRELIRMRRRLDAALKVVDAARKLTPYWRGDMGPIFQETFGANGLRAAVAVGAALAEFDKEKP